MAERADDGPGDGKESERPVVRPASIWPRASSTEAFSPVPPTSIASVHLPGVDNLSDMTDCRWYAIVTSQPGAAISVRRADDARMDGLRQSPHQQLYRDMAFS